VIFLAPKSLTFRLTLLFATVSTIVLLLLGLLIGTLVEKHFEEMDTEVLTGKLEFLKHALSDIKTQKELNELPHKLNDALNGHSGLEVALYLGEKKPLYLTSDTMLPDALLTPEQRAHQQPYLWVDEANMSYRGISADIQTSIADAPPIIAVVATSLRMHEHFMESFRTTLWTVMALAALLTGFLGWLAAWRGLAPLQDIRRSAAAITADRLNQRLAANDFPLELAEVAETLNAMLARLESSFRRLSDFSSDLAHELRTPVSNLLTQTQVTLSKTRTLNKYQDVLASNSEELERLSRMIGDMLFLAKSDNDLISLNSKEVNLAVEVQALLEFYNILAEEKDIELSLEGDGIVIGDPLMLRRAVSNLLSNAIRHTPERGTVVVRIKWGGDGVMLSVENTGPTIPPEQRPRLFDRFYRGDAARQRTGDGTGLGLAITQSIMHAHGGDATVASENGLTRFDLTFPPHTKS
jgi:two-component system heavy metal sensor histidine kinase CusS